MTTPDQTAAPTLQLSDLATADLQLVLDGSTLPWPDLGSSVSVVPVPTYWHGDAPSGTVHTPGAGAVGIGVPDALAQEALAAGRLVLADRELTPIAELVELVELEPSRARPTAREVRRGSPVTCAR